MNSIYGLNKDYLSYSAWNTWLKSKDEYRRIYYEKGEKFNTTETIFGKKIAELLEKTGELSHVPRLPIAEHGIVVEVEGVKLMGYLDTFCDQTFAIGEHKTGHLSRDGKVPWDKVKVQKHKQLDWYSFLVKTKYGKVKNKIFLNWLETEFEEKSMEFGGHTLKAQTRELKLTGKVVTFWRNIYEWQRKKIKEEILSVAKEIENDYKEYCSTRDGKAIAQEVAKV